MAQVSAMWLGTQARRIYHIRKGGVCFVSSLTLLTAAFPLTAQKIEYDKVEPSILEERLNRVTDKNPEREQDLRELFEKVGCAQEQLLEQRVKGSRTPNVICTLKGTEENSIVVGALRQGFERSWRRR